MKNSRVLEINGYIFTIFGIIFYVLHEFIPVFFIQAIAAVFLVVAVWNLFGSMQKTKKENTAIERYEQFEQLKKHMTKNYKTKTNANSKRKTKNEKSEDDAHS
jgi:hypothetical protein